MTRLMSAWYVKTKAKNADSVMLKKNAPFLLIQFSLSYIR